MKTNNKRLRKKRQNKKNKLKKDFSHNYNEMATSTRHQENNLELSHAAGQNEESQVRKQIPDIKTNISLKHDLENDSDVEDKPKIKKKKKKRLTTEASSTSSKDKKSIRQMKREKHAERQMATVALAKDTLKQQNMQYLLQWKHDKSNWKFMKARQIWLFKNKFSDDLIPDNIWPTLLNYFESAQGNVKKMLLNDANNIIKAMDAWTDFQNSEVNDCSEESAEKTVKKPDDVSYKRARDIIQNIDE